MTSPKSLLELAGAASHPSPLDRSALILIDPQEEYVTGAVPLAGIDAAVEAAATLLRIARDAGVPIFHIHHHGKRGGALFDPDGPFVQAIRVSLRSRVRKSLSKRCPIPSLTPISLLGSRRLGGLS